MLTTSYATSSFDDDDDDNDGKVDDVDADFHATTAEFPTTLGLVFLDDGGENGKNNDDDDDDDRIDNGGGARWNARTKGGR